MIALRDARHGEKSENVNLCCAGTGSEERVIDLVPIHLDDGSVESWTDECDGDKMRADFERCVTEM